jgi:cell division protein YceG involved in septum cleavage
MNIKTSLIIIGLAIVAIIVFFVINPKDSTIANPDANNEATVEVPENQDLAEPTESEESIEDSETVESTGPGDPAFPTTGFEPKN